ncbi:MAG TPA: prepilin-type N-terminal cleavage/methylation domain-containing protein [Gemmatimonadaceae bacterium]|nr:prepilin-type N-terminal cleavage/methylation domain-containing protein [Gemmatimonadaceae bacterium]
MLTHMPTRSDRPARAGFSLIELMITIVLLGIVMGSLLNVILRQQRFYRGANEIIDTRSQVRQAAELLPADLRGISTAPGAVLGVDVADLYVDGMGLHGIAYRSTFGSSVSCVIDATRRIITLPPLTLASGNTLTAWLREPAPGDSLFIFDDQGTPGGVGQWVPAQIQAVAQAVGACPSATGLTSAADDTRPSWVVTVVDALPATIPIGNRPGNPIRFFQPVLYELYQAGDGQWYLGFADCRTGRVPACTELQPVAGPYLAPSADPAVSGLTFEYLNENSAAAATPQDVASIRITFRGETVSDVKIDGLTTTNGRHRSEMTVVVGIRNRT